MENNKQIQKAGENSQQYQIGTVVVNQGITEERVRDIFQEMIHLALQIYTNDAYEVALKRIAKLEEKILPKLSKIEGMLPAFGDPAYQFLLRKAQQTAAATEREDDYALLSELLAYHVQKGKDRKNRAAIFRTVEMIDQIDNDALCALTVAHAVIRYGPAVTNLQKALDMLDSLFSQLIYQELPDGIRWLEHLDILGAMRTNEAGKLRKLPDYYPQRLNGIVCIGIKNGSDDHKIAIDILKDAQISTDFLVSNECLEGYKRLNINNEDSIKTLVFDIEGERIPLSNAQIEAVTNVLALYCKDAKLQNLVKENFIQSWDSHETLYKLRIWWESIPWSFRITGVGEILAHINAKRCSPQLPDYL